MKHKGRECEYCGKPLSGCVCDSTTRGLRGMHNACQAFETGDPVGYINKEYGTDLKYDHPVRFLVDDKGEKIVLLHEAMFYKKAWSPDEGKVDQLNKMWEEQGVGWRHRAYFVEEKWLWNYYIRMGNILIRMPFSTPKAKELGTQDWDALMQEWKFEAAARKEPLTVNDYIDHGQGFSYWCETIPRFNPKNWHIIKFKQQIENELFTRRPIDFIKPPSPSTNSG